MPAPADPPRVYAVIVHRVVSAGVFEIACGLDHRRPCRQRVHLTGLVLPSTRSAAGRAAKTWVEAWVRVHTRNVEPPALWLTLLDPRPPHAERVPLHGRLTAPDGCPLDVAIVEAGVGSPAARI